MKPISPYTLRPPAALVIPAMLLLPATACTKAGKDDSGSGSGSGTASSSDTGTTATQVADILFVLDNSSSMAGELGQAGGQVSALLDALQAGEAVDYRLAITTTTPYDVASNGLDPGEGGLLVGEVFDTESSSSAVREQVLCHTVYWPTDTPRSNAGEVDCGGPPDGAITQEYLDCVCGFDEWRYTREGSGTEEHLESALMALCRSVDIPPDSCADPLSVFGDTSDITNPTWIRPESEIHVLIVTDEGDSSRRIPPTGDGLDQATPYIEAFEQFDQAIRVSVVGPLFDPDTDSAPRCVEGAGFGGYLVERFQDAVDQTGGIYRPIVSDDSGSCEATDFAEHYRALDTLLRAEVAR